MTDPNGSSSVRDENIDPKELQARIEAFGDQLRAKISSKFQTSTFLAGLSFAILGIQILNKG